MVRMNFDEILKHEILVKYYKIEHFSMEQISSYTQNKDDWLFDLSYTFVPKNADSEMFVGAFNVSVSVKGEIYDNMDMYENMMTIFEVFDWKYREE